MPVSLAIDTLILPLSRPLLSVFLLPTSSPATFKFVEFVESERINTLAQVLHHTETETETETETDKPSSDFRVRISLSCKKNFVLCSVEC